jgi:hypothetical protein
VSRSGDPRGCPAGRNCRVCSDRAKLRYRARRAARPADMTEAKEWQAMDHVERDIELNGDPCGYPGCPECDRGWCGTDAADRLDASAPPLRVPLGHVTRMRTTNLGSAAARAIFGAILATLLVACTPPPAWLPGDPPLAILADTDATWEAIAGGCERWSMTGLTCERVWHGDDATIIAKSRKLEPFSDGSGANGYSKARPQTGHDFEPEWGRFIVLDVGILETLDGPVIAAHEIGHHLGIWEHINYDVAPWALMRGYGTLIGSAAAVSEADLEALEQAWGIPREEW